MQPEPGSAFKAEAALCAEVAGLAIAEDSNARPLRLARGFSLIHASVADPASVGAWNPLCDIRRHPAVAGTGPLLRARQCAWPVLVVRIPDSEALVLSPERRVTEAEQMPVDADDGLNRLYRRYGDWLNRRLRARIGPDMAADVVQETYLKIAPYAAADIRHPKAFLWKVALNLVRDHHRKEVRRSSALEQFRPVVAESAPQVDQIMLGEIVASMPQLYRDVFVLSRFSGMTYPEIARTLAISVNTVERRMSRALEYCASRLDL